MHILFSIEEYDIFYRSIMTNSHNAQNAQKLKSICHLFALYSFIFRKLSVNDAYSEIFILYLFMYLHANFWSDPVQSSYVFLRSIIISESNSTVNYLLFTVDLESMKVIKRSQSLKK